MSREDPAALLVVGPPVHVAAGGPIVPPHEFYDAANAGPSEDRRVRNRVDRHADLPLIAHVQYWNNPLLGICLLEALNAPAQTYGVQAT